MIEVDLCFLDFVEVETNHEPEEIFVEPKLIPVDECVTKKEKPIEETKIVKKPEERSSPEKRANNFDDLEAYNANLIEEAGEYLREKRDQERLSHKIESFVTEDAKVN